MIKKLFFTVCMFFFFLSSIQTVLASNQTIYVPDQEIIQGLYFKNAENITIDGEINGETYLIGENVIINGKIDGDAIIVGSNVDVNGNISENLRIIGSQVHISGNVGKNLTIIAWQTNVENKSRVMGNMVIFGNKSQIFGQIQGESRITTRETYAAGKFEKPVTFISPDLSISKDAVFKKGKIIKTEESKNNMLFWSNNKLIQLFLGKAKTFGNFLSFLGYLTIGLALTFLFPKNFTNINHFLTDKPLASFIIGLLFYLVLPFIVIFIAMTIVGIPISLVIFAIMLIILFVSRIITALSIGSLILKDNDSKFFPLLLGLIILQLVFWIPFFGIVFKVVTILVGSGALLLSKLGKINR
jgi:hypothetical protein